MRFLMVIARNLPVLLGSALQRIIGWACFSRCVAVLLVQCFLVSFVFSEAVAGLIAAAQDSSAFQAACTPTVIPQSAGRVTAARYFGSKEVVISIQDLHCHAEVQKNIARILAALDEKYHLKNVYLEGSSGNVDTSWLTGIQDKETREELVNALVASGKLTGAEYYSVQAERPDLICGIEDQQLYQANLKRLGMLLEEQDVLRSVLSDMDSDVQRVTRAYYNQKQARFFRMQEKYRNGRLETRKYFTFLVRQGEKLGIDVYSYRNLVSYLRALDQEQKLDYAAISREMRAYIAVLKQKLPYSAYQDLVQRTGNFAHLDRAYAELARLYTVLQSAGTGIRYTRLEHFFAYLQESQNINPIHMVHEETLLAREINRLLASNQSARDVAFLADCARVFRNYAENKISAREYEVFAGDLTEFKRLWRIYADTEILSSLAPYFQLWESYYETNLARNRQFVASLFGEQMRASGTVRPVSDGADAEQIFATLNAAKDVRVVITGGFHTEGVSDILEKAGISYVVITPGVTTGTKTAEQVYRALAQEQARFAGQSFALQALSREPSLIKAREAADAITAACIAEARENGASAQDTDKKIRALVGKIGLFSTVDFNVQQNGDGSFSITLTYTEQENGAAVQRVSVFTYDAAGNRIGQAQKQTSTLEIPPTVLKGLGPLRTMPEDEDPYDGCIGKFDAVRVEEMRQLDDGHVKVILWVRPSGTDREERVELIGTPQGNTLLQQDLAEIQKSKAPLMGKLAAFLKATPIDDMVIHTVILPEGSRLHATDIRGVGIAVNLQTGKPLRLLHETVKDNRVARLHELQHIAAGVIQQDETPWLTLDEILGSVTDRTGTILRNEYTVKINKISPESLKIHYALRAYQQQYFPRENRELSALIEKPRIQEALLTYAGNSVRKRSKNFIRTSLSDALRRKDYNRFRAVFGAMVEVIDAQGTNNRELEVNAITRIVSELKKAQSHNRAARVNEYLERIIAEEGSSPMGDAATKVLRWVDVGRVVWISPEAEAVDASGGMAMVVTQLAEKLGESGLWVDIITPMYQVNKKGANVKDNFEYGSSPYHEGEIDFKQFKTESTKQYELINDVLENYGVNTSAFNKLIAIPNLIELLDNNKGHSSAQAGEADRITINKNKKKLAEIYPHALAMSKQYTVRYPVGNIAVNMGKGETAVAGIGVAKVGHVRYLLPENHEYAYRLYNEGDAEYQEQCAQFLCYADVLGALGEDDRETICIANDWMTAPFFAWAIKQNKGYILGGYIHNHEYRGILYRGPEYKDILSNLELNDPEMTNLFVHQKNSHNTDFFNAYLHLAQFLIAVSPTFAEELLRGLYGDQKAYERLDRSHGFYGIANGVLSLEMLTAMYDETLAQRIMKARENPSVLDPKILDQVRKEKKEAKKRIAADPEFWWSGTPPALDEDTLVFDMISRMDYQKGIPHVAAFVDEVMQRYPHEKIVFLFGGSGAMENQIEDLVTRYPGKIGFYKGFISGDQKYDILKAGDNNLAFSLFEPGGISPMEALLGGSVILASNKQGLKDTVKQKENGIRFDIDPWNDKVTLDNIKRAFDWFYQIYQKEPDQWDQLQWNALMSDNDWSRTVDKLENVLKYQATKNEDYYKKLFPAALGAVEKTVTGQMAVVWFDELRNLVIPMDYATTKALRLNTTHQRKLRTSLRAAFASLEEQDKRDLFDFQKGHSIQRHTGQWMELPLPVRVEAGLKEMAAVTPHEIILNADLLRAPPEVLTLVLQHALRRSIHRFTPYKQSHDADIFQETLRYFTDHPDVAKKWYAWVEGKPSVICFDRDWKAPLAQASAVQEFEAEAMALLNAASRYTTDWTAFEIPGTEKYIEKYRNRNGAEQVHVYFIKQFGDGIQKVIRIIPPGTRDWMATRDAREQVVVRDDVCIDFLRDTQSVAEEIAVERRIFKQHPWLIDRINAIVAGTAPEQKAAITDLRACVLGQQPGHEKAFEMLFSLSRTFPDRVVRIALNRFAFDRLTERPLDFPQATSNYTAENDVAYTQTILVDFTGKQPPAARVRWLQNGKRHETKLKLDKIEGTQAYYTWRLPKKNCTGWIHYAVQIQDEKSSWVYLQGSADNPDRWLDKEVVEGFTYNSCPEDRANGVLKFLKTSKVRNILSLRPMAANLIRENGYPRVDEYGNMLFGTFADLEKQLEDIKAAGYDALYINVHELGAPGEDEENGGPDPSPFAILHPLRVDSRIGGMAGLDKLTEKAQKLGVAIIIDEVLHRSRSDRSSSAARFIWIWDEASNSFVRMAGNDGGYSLTEWNDSAMPLLSLATLQELMAQAAWWSAQGKDFRFDVAHASDSSFEPDPLMVGMPAIRGDMVSGRKKWVNQPTLGGWRLVPETNDLRGTREPNAILGALVYAAMQANPEVLFLGEEYHDNFWRLVLSGLIPFDSLVVNMGNVIKNGHSVKDFYENLKYKEKIRSAYSAKPEDPTGRQAALSVTAVSNQDEGVPVAEYDMYGHKAFVAMAASEFMSEINSLHVYDLNADPLTRKIDQAKASAEMYRYPVNNFGPARNYFRKGTKGSYNSRYHLRSWPGFDGQAKEAATRRGLEENPHLSALGAVKSQIGTLIEGCGPAQGINTHDDRVLGVGRRQGEDTLVGFFNFSNDQVNIHCCINRSKHEPFAGVEDFNDEAVYEIREVYRNDKDLSQPPFRQLVTGWELNNLGMSPDGALPGVGYQVYRIHEIRPAIYASGENGYNSLLQDSLRRTQTHGYALHDRKEYSFFVSELERLVRENNQEGFVRAYTALLSLPETSTALQESMRMVAERLAGVRLRARLTDFLAAAKNVSSIENSRESHANGGFMIKKPRGGKKAANIRVEYIDEYQGDDQEPEQTLVRNHRDGTVEFSLRLYRPDRAKPARVTIYGRRADPERRTADYFKQNFIERTFTDSAGSPGSAQRSIHYSGGKRYDAVCNNILDFFQKYPAIDDIIITDVVFDQNIPELVDDVLTQLGFTPADAPADLRTSIREALKYGYDKDLLEKQLTADQVIIEKYAHLVPSLVSMITAMQGTSGWTAADVIGMALVFEGKQPLRGLREIVADNQSSQFHEAGHMAHAAGMLTIEDVLDAVTDGNIQRWYKRQTMTVDPADTETLMHYALRAFQQQYMPQEDALLTDAVNRFYRSGNKGIPAWFHGMRACLIPLRNMVFSGDKNRFGSYAEMLTLVRHFTRVLKKNVLEYQPMLMPESISFGRSSQAVQLRGESPYEPLSPYLLDTRGIIWKTAGFSGKTPTERLAEFQKRGEQFSREFIRFITNAHIQEGVDLVVLRILKYGNDDYGQPFDQRLFDTINDRSSATPGNESVRKTELYGKLLLTVMMEQYIAAKQVRNGNIAAHRAGQWSSIDLPFLRTMGGSDAFIRPGLFMQNNSTRKEIVAASYKDEQKWGDQERQIGLGNYDLQALKQSGYRAILDVVEYYITELGFDIVRMDAIHFLDDPAKTHEAFFNELAQLRDKYRVLIYFETLGDYAPDDFNRWCMERGFPVVANAGGKLNIQGWQGDKLMQLMDVLVAMSHAPYVWRPVSHDTARLVEEFGLLLEGIENTSQEKAKALHAIFGLALPNSIVIAGDEDGDQRRINIPATVHAWHMASPYLEQAPDHELRQFLRDIDTVREQYPDYFDRLGTLAHPSRKGDFLEFQRTAPGKGVLKISINLRSGAYTVTEYALVAMPRRGHAAMVRHIVAAARELSAGNSSWAGQFYEQYRSCPPDAKFTKAFGDAMKVLLFDQNLDVQRGAAWILSHDEFAGNVICTATAVHVAADPSILKTALYCPVPKETGHTIRKMYDQAPKEKQQWILAQLLASITVALKEEERRNALDTFHSVFGPTADPVHLLKQKDRFLYGVLKKQSMLTDTEEVNVFAAKLDHLLAAVESSLIATENYTQKTVIHVVKEFAPIAQEGGLAVKMEEILSELASKDQRVIVVMPAYQKGDAPQEKEQGVITDPDTIEIRVPVAGKSVTVHVLRKHYKNITLYCLEHPRYFSRMYPRTRQEQEEPTQLEESVLLSRAAFLIAEKEGLPPVHILHAHNWQTGLALKYLKEIYRKHPLFEHTRAVYSPHDNYAGTFSEEHWRITGLPGDEQQEMVSLARTGLEAADLVVSEGQQKQKNLNVPEANGCSDLYWRAEHEGRYIGIPYDQKGEALNTAYDNLLYAATGNKIYEINLQALTGYLRAMHKPLPMLVANFLAEKATGIVSDAFGIMPANEHDMEVSLQVWKQHIWNLIPGIGALQEAAAVPFEAPSFDAKNIAEALQQSLYADKAGAHNPVFSDHTMRLLNNYARATILDENTLDHAITIIEAFQQLEERERNIIARGLQEKYRGKTAPAVLYVVLLMYDATDGLSNSIAMNTDQILLNLRRYITRKRRTVALHSRILPLLQIYAKAFELQRNYPVEAAWPVLKAMVRLEKDEEAAILALIQKTYKDAKYPLLFDHLMLNKKRITRQWVEKYAAHLKNRVLYLVSAEISYWGGGLGPVMVFIAKGMKKLGLKYFTIVQIQPGYEFRRDMFDAQGNLVRLDYGAPGSTRLFMDETCTTPGVTEYCRYTVQLDGRQIMVKVARGYNEDGIAQYLISDDQGDGSSYYTKFLYNYREPYKTVTDPEILKTQNPATREEFIAFYGLASAELIKILEHKRVAEMGSEYRPGIVECNDGQCAAIPITIRSLYRADTIMQSLMCEVKTHTYANRGIIDAKEAVRLLRAMGIERKYLPAFLHDSKGDWTSLGTKIADLVTAVSAKHRDDVIGLDPGISMVAHTNGAVPEMMAKVFRTLFRKHGWKDTDRPTAEQIMAVKREAKQHLNSLKLKTVNGRTVKIDTDAICVGSAVRLVPEKAGAERAYIKATVLAAVKRGSNFVLLEALQASYQRSVELRDYFAALENEVARLKQEQPAVYTGNFFIVDTFTGDEKIAALAAMDIQILDSDQNEAAGLSETDILANGGLLFAPSWPIGVFWSQGTPIDWAHPGVGNTIIPNSSDPADYQEALLEAIDVWNDPAKHLGFYEHCATSMRFNRIQYYWLTSAASLRDKDRVVGRIEEETHRDQEILRRMVASMDRPDKFHQVIGRGEQPRRKGGAFAFSYKGFTVVDDTPVHAEGVLRAASGSLTDFINTKRYIEDTYGYNALQEHFQRGDYTKYLMTLFNKLDTQVLLHSWLRELQQSDATDEQKESRFTVFLEQLSELLEDKAALNGIIDAFNRAPGQLAAVESTGRNDVAAFAFCDDAQVLQCAYNPGIQGFVLAMEQLAANHREALQEHLIKGHYSAYLTKLFEGLDAASALQQWLASLQDSREPAERKFTRFMSFMQVLMSELYAVNERQGEQEDRYHQVAAFETLPIRPANAHYHATAMRDGHEVKIRSVDEAKDFGEKLAEKEITPITIKGKTIEVIIEQRPDGIRISADEIGSLIQAALDRTGSTVDKLPSTIVIAFLDKSSYLFEDHVGNGFIGINTALFEEAMTPARQKFLLLLGLFHELCHEVTGQSGEAFEQSQRVRDEEFLLGMMVVCKVSTKSLENIFPAGVDSSAFRESVEARIALIKENRSHLSHDLKSQVITMFQTLCVLANEGEDVPFEQLPTGSPVRRMHEILASIEKEISDSATRDDNDDALSDEERKIIALAMQSMQSGQAPRDPLQSLLQDVKFKPEAGSAAQNQEWQHMALVVNLREKAVQLHDLLSEEFMKDLSFELRNFHALIDAYPTHSFGDAPLHEEMMRGLLKDPQDSSPLIEGYLKDILPDMQLGSDIMASLYPDMVSPAQDINLGDVSESVLRALKRKTERARISWSPESRVVVNGDMTLHAQRLGLVRALNNCANNAFDAFQKKYGTKSDRQFQFTITLSEQDNMIVIALADNAGGIDLPASDDGKPVDIFQDGVTSKDNPDGSHGHGLAITMNAIRELGGTIAYTSEPDEGTTFIITLPRTPVDSGKHTFLGFEMSQMAQAVLEALRQQAPLLVPAEDALHIITLWLQQTMGNELSIPEDPTRYYDERNALLKIINAKKAEYRAALIAAGVDDALPVDVQICGGAFLPVQEDTTVSGIALGSMEIRNGTIVISVAEGLLSAPQLFERFVTHEFSERAYLNQHPGKQYTDYHAVEPDHWADTLMPDIAIQLAKLFVDNSSDAEQQATPAITIAADMPLDPAAHERALYHMYANSPYYVDPGIILQPLPVDAQNALHALIRAIKEPNEFGEEIPAHIFDAPDQAELLHISIAEQLAEKRTYYKEPFSEKELQEIRTALETCLQECQSFEGSLDGVLSLKPDGTLILRVTDKNLVAGLERVRAAAMKHPAWSRQKYQSSDFIYLTIGMVCSQNYTPAQLKKIRSIITAYNTRSTPKAQQFWNVLQKTFTVTAVRYGQFYEQAQGGVGVTQIPLVVQRIRKTDQADNDHQSPMLSPVLTMGGQASVGLRAEEIQRIVRQSLQDEHQRSANEIHEQAAALTERMLRNTPVLPQRARSQRKNFIDYLTDALQAEFAAVGVAQPLPITVTIVEGTFLREDSMLNFATMRKRDGRWEVLVTQGLVDTPLPRDRNRALQRTQAGSKTMDRDEKSQVLARSLVQQLYGQRDQDEASEKRMRNMLRDEILTALMATASSRFNRVLARSRTDGGFVYKRTTTSAYVEELINQASEGYAGITLDMDYLLRLFDNQETFERPEQTQQPAELQTREKTGFINKYVMQKAEIDDAPPIRSGESYRETTSYINAVARRDNILAIIDDLLAAAPSLTKKLAQKNLSVTMHMLHAPFARPGGGLRYPDPETDSELFEKILNLCDKLGVDVVTVPLQAPLGDHEVAAYAGLVTRAAAYGHNLRIAFENSYCDGTKPIQPKRKNTIQDYCDTLMEVAAMLTDDEHAHMTIAYNPVHVALNGEDPVAAYERIASLKSGETQLPISIITIAQTNGSVSLRYESLGNKPLYRAGKIPLNYFFDLLQKDGYTGYILQWEEFYKQQIPPVHDVIKQEIMAVMQKGGNPADIGYSAAVVRAVTRKITDTIHPWTFRHAPVLTDRTIAYASFDSPQLQECALVNDAGMRSVVITAGNQGDSLQTVYVDVPGKSAPVPVRVFLSFEKTEAEIRVPVICLDTQDEYLFGRGVLAFLEQVKRMGYMTHPDPVAEKLRAAGIDLSKENGPAVINVTGARARYAIPRMCSDRYALSSIGGAAAVFYTPDAQPVLVSADTFAAAFGSKEFISSCRMPDGTIDVNRIALLAADIVRADIRKIYPDLADSAGYPFADVVDESAVREMLATVAVPAVINKEREYASMKVVKPVEMVNVLGLRPDAQALTARILARWPGVQKQDIISRAEHGTLNTPVGTLADIPWYMQTFDAQALQLLPLAAQKNDSPFDVVSPFAFDDRCIDWMDPSLSIKGLTMAHVLTDQFDANYIDWRDVKTQQQQLNKLMDKAPLNPAALAPYFEANAYWLLPYIRSVLNKELRVKGARISKSEVASFLRDAQVKAVVYRQCIAYAQLIKVLKVLHNDGRSLYCWVDITSDTRDLMLNNDDNPGVLHHWLALGFDGIRVTVSDPKLLTEEYIKQLSTAISNVSPAIMSGKKAFIKISGEIDTARREQLERAGFVVIAGILASPSVMKGRAVDIDTPSDPVRPCANSTVQATLGADQGAVKVKEFYDSLLTYISHAQPETIFAVTGTLRGDPLPFVTGADQGIHFNLRAPTASDSNRNLLAMSLDALNKFVRGQLLAMLPSDAYEVGSRYTAQEIPENWPLEEIFAAVISYNKMGSQHDPQQVFQAINTALSSQSDWAGKHYLNNLYKRMRALPDSAREEKQVYADAACAFVRGINEQVAVSIVSRAHATGVEGIREMPDDAFDQKIYKALGSMCAGLGIAPESLMTLYAEDASSKKTGKVVGVILKAFRDRVNIDLVNNVMKKNRGFTLDDLGAWERVYMAVMSNSLGYDLNAEEMRTLLNPLFLELIKEGLIGEFCDYTTEDDREACIYAVVQIYRIFDVIAIRQDKDLMRRIKEASEPAINSLLTSYIQSAA